MLALKIGWRNLKRRRSRSILTGLMFFIGTYLLVFFVGLAEGTYEGMLRLGTRVWSGDFQIMEPSYRDKPALYKTVPQITKAQLDNPEIQAVTPRIESFGLLAKGNKTIGTLLCGVVPEHELKVSGFSKTLQNGTWWSTKDVPFSTIPLVAGTDVLRRLDAKLGDELSFVSQAADGSIAAELYRVTGILSTGIAELDREAVFIPLQEAQSLLALQGRVHRIVGIVKNRNRLSDITEQFKKSQISTGAPPTQKMFPWNEIMPELENTIKADREGLYLFLFIIMAVVLLGVANTMMMSVMERTFELGLLQALGTSPLALIRIILAEIFWLGTIGVSLGVLSGVLTVFLLGDTGIPMGDYTFSYGGVQVNSMIPILTIKSTVVFPVFIMLSGMVSGLIPAIKAAKTLPAKALGRTL